MDHLLEVCMVAPPAAPTPHSAMMCLQVALVGPSNEIARLRVVQASLFAFACALNLPAVPA